MAVPMTAPMKQNRMFVPVRAMSNPLIRPVKISKPSTPLSDETLRWDRHLQEVDEKGVHRDGSEDRDDERLDPLFALNDLLPGNHEDERRGDITDGFHCPAVKHHENQG